MASNCELCMNYYYDDDYECYTCAIDLDQDEMAMFIQNSFKSCPYFRMGDEYTIVKKQI